MVHRLISSTYIFLRFPHVLLFSPVLGFSDSDVIVMGDLMLIMELGMLLQAVLEVMTYYLTSRTATFVF
jgi:hypothetical protein